MNRQIKRLFENLCCSRCKSDFDENSINILRQEDELCIVRLQCQNCRKSFGIAILGLNKQEIEDSVCKNEDFPLEIQDGSPPITYDDVLDAHKFIQNLSDDWAKYCPKPQES